ncbi:MAG TPA: hypothetical protein VM243_09420 [Phycisphaerae bacterium]|nr:hypothetical protein [Phycisphaerae bacterium]
MKRVTLLGAVVALAAVVAGCVMAEGSPGPTQYNMKAWDRNTHQKLGEWYVYRDWLGEWRTVDNDALVSFANATIVLEQNLPPTNRIVLRQHSEDDR